MRVAIPTHPLLDLGAIVAEFPQDLGELKSQDELLDWLKPDVTLADLPFAPPDDDVKKSIRDVLRHGGFKPTGRSKPASEYLIKATTAGTLGSINVAVDICNVVSRYSGIPISVLDADRLQDPLEVKVAEKGESYVFNASGQELDLSGLLCLYSAGSPSGNGVKDSQSTKTHDGTRRTLSLFWGSNELEGRTTAAMDWYRHWLTTHGASVSSVEWHTNP